MRVLFRDTKSIVIITRKWVIKLPYTYSGFLEMKEDRENMKKLRQDVFFSKYLPKHFWIGIILITPYMERASEEQMNQYFLLPKKDTIHGDLIPQNTYTKNNRIYFLDWNRYQKNNPEFDKINYYASKKKSWLEGTDRKDFILWKIIMEIEGFNKRGTYTKEKRKKYWRYLNLIIKELN